MNRYSTLFLTLALFVTTVAHSQYALQTGKMQVNAGLGGIGGGGIPIFVCLDYGYDNNNDYLMSIRSQFCHSGVTICTVTPE
jgi:hypothetical protein